jgi:hypothetical protein
MKKLLTILVVLASVFSLSAQSKTTYKVDSKNNVVFTSIIEDLPLSRDEIYKAALSYLETAYKDTRYKITLSSPENGSVAGTGNFASIHEHSNLTSSKIISADFTLRVDAQDGRARMQIIVRKYDLVVLCDTKSKRDEDVLVSSVAPIADNSTDRKNYTKTFEKLSALVDRTFDSVATTLKNTTSAAPADNEEW